MINIPDLLRLETRSWQGAAIAQDYYPAVMPHIRAIDVNLAEPLAMRRSCGKAVLQRCWLLREIRPRI